jgi:hypothetical protein
MTGPSLYAGMRRQLLFASIVVFAAGAFVGAVLQKSYGIGNLLRAAGIPYPSSAPPVPAGPANIEIPPEDQGRLSLFVLAGQSNMSGWAAVPLNQATDPRIYLFGNDYRWREAVEPIDDAYLQVDKVSEDRAAGMGPALAFATALVQHDPQLAIGIIPCARSASGIIEWQRNLSDRSLYGSCLKRARAASPMGEIASILFFQGENDAELNPKVRPRPAEWARLFSRLVAEWRHDLADSNLPVVFAQLGAIESSIAYPNLELVKAQQRSIDLPHVSMITTDDLPLLDGVHFTADSYRTIGERFAQAYRELR